MGLLTGFLVQFVLVFGAPAGPEGAERIAAGAPPNSAAPTVVLPVIPDSLSRAAIPATVPRTPGLADSLARPNNDSVVLPAKDTVASDTSKTSVSHDTTKDSTSPSLVPAPAILPLAPPVPTPTIVVPSPTVRPVTTFRTIAIGIDTTGRSRKGRSTWAAVGLTMLLPGAGHRYLGHKTGAAVWMTTDLVNWSSLLVAAKMGSMYIEDATEIANRHAGASLDADADPAFLEVVRDWRSRRPVQGRRDSYDEALLQQGIATDSRFPNDDAHDWDWGSPENPENNRNIGRFEDALKGYRTSRVVLSYAAGALLLSRTVAVADILRIRRKSASRAGLQAVVVPGPDGGWAALSLRF